jgi:hypothetical protein
MRRQKWWLFFVTVVVLIMGTGVQQDAHGAPLAQTGTLDQAQEDHPPFYYTGVSTRYSMAQTFTAGRSGLLDHVDVLIKCQILCQDTSANIIVQIQQVDTSSVPNNTLDSIKVGI